MATSLSSPGVSVTVTDNTLYASGTAGSVPLVVFATAQNKVDPTGASSVAPGTTSANAGLLTKIASKSELIANYGNPFFYTSANGTPIHGYELNEYGLMAAYSALDVTNSMYCLRADIDLAALVGSVTRPTSNPANGTIWLDTANSTWGINEFNATTGAFTLKTPIVISSASQLSSGIPLQSLGSIGDYAVKAIPSYNYPSSTAARQFFYKTPANAWVAVGSKAWQALWPTVQGTATPTTLTAGNTLIISMSGGPTFSVTVPASPNNTVTNLVTQINGLGYSGVSAASVNGKLALYSTQSGATPNYTTPFNIALSGTGLTELGLTSGTFYQPAFTYSTAASQPLWTSGQTYPRPTGSVWIRVGSATNSLQSKISTWNSTSATWVASTYNYATSDWVAINSLDSTGGATIPAGTIYTQYAFDTDTIGFTQAPVYYWERASTGATVVTGSVTAPTFANGSYTVSVQVSIPGSASLGSYSFALANNTTGADFVNAWNNAAIPYTSAIIAASGAIQISHLKGGVIILSDFVNGVSKGLLQDAGFISGATQFVKDGPAVVTTFTAAQTSTSGVGTGAQFNVSNRYQNYFVNPVPATAGTGYNVGDLITISGTALGGATTANDLVLKVMSVNSSSSNAITGVAFVSGSGATAYSIQLSNWVEIDVTASDNAPVLSPVANTNWYFSSVSDVDIMVNTSTGWKGYKNATYDSNGLPLPTGTNTTDPAGPLVSASMPTTQSDGTVLVYGDIWIDTSDLENYPVINRWQAVNGVSQWVTLDNTDQTSSSGVVFADARWATSGSIDPAAGTMSTIVSLLASDYLDLDAPSSALYPVGTLLFNTRRSGYTVKQFKVNYFNSTSYPLSSLPTYTSTWVTISGNKADGSPYMGRKAQRQLVVESLKEVITTNTAIEDVENYFNIITCPGYPELHASMIELDTARSYTSFVIGDTPARLVATSAAIESWATNAKNATSTGDDGFVTKDTSLAVFYPGGLTSDVNGNDAYVPGSHMMLYTMLNNDNIAYPWYAAAGTTRGVIQNATSIGYIDPTTGEYVTVTNSNIGIRDTLYTNSINPLVYFQSNGLLCYGNKTSDETSTAMDRINVSRLVAYLRRQLDIAGRPFVFEPNVATTRSALAAVIETLLVNLISTNAISDYLVVCDTSNNTPAVIDANQLICNVAIVPVRSAEFIYIPLVLENTIK